MHEEKTQSSFFRKRGRSRSRSRRRVAPRGAFGRNVVPRGSTLAGEVKSVDTGVGSIAIPSTSASCTPIYDTATGADVYHRVGRKVALKSVRLRGFFVDTKSMAAATTAEVLRVVLFSDNQYTSGGGVVTSDVLQDLSNAGATATTSSSGLNLNNRDRFKVLRDIYIQMPAKPAYPGAYVEGAEGGNAKEVYTYNWFVPLRGFEISHSANSLGAVSKGMIAIAVIGDIGGQWSFGFNARVRFTDV